MIQSKDESENDAILESIPVADDSDCSESSKSYYKLIDDHINSTYPNVKKTTSGQYRTVLLKIARDLEANGRSIDPYVFDKETLIYVREVLWEGSAVSTKRWNTHILERFLKFYGNNLVESMHFITVQDRRPHVDWLSKEQCRALIKASKSPLQETVIYLELNCGLRSAEVIRLRLADINFENRFMNVCGKGKGDGKWRMVPFGEDTEKVLKQWIKERDRMISRMRKVDPTWIPPENLLIYQRYTAEKIVTNAYTERGHSLDRSVIHPLRTSLGFHFSHHTLRRSFARNLYKSNVPFASISMILGHEDPNVTMRYVGADYDEMVNSISMLNQYMDE